MERADRWDPAQYEKFKRERSQPFAELVALVRPRERMRVLDLGCGTGELSASLLERWPGCTVEGVDSSPEMVTKARAAAAGTNGAFTVRQGDIADERDFERWDLVLSNAALQWVPDNERLMARLLDGLRSGAQVAVQVPKNEGHPSHRIARALAAEPRWRGRLGGHERRSEALAAERYAEILWQHGFREQLVFEKVYGHELARTADVVEWTKGTLLVPYLSRLEDPDRAAFLDEYRERLVTELGDRAPYFYPFRRLLFWGAKG